MMNRNAKRFKDTGAKLLDFRDQISVECPKCSNKATITKDDGGVKLSCSSCNHHESDDLIRYSLLIKRYCDTCGHRIIIEEKDLKEKKELVVFTCPNCKTRREYEGNYSKYKGSIDSKQEGYDPYLNLPLWYKSLFNKDLFWAYNEKHLEFLKEYIGAKIRERQSGAGSSMVEKLPDFIKSSKNREKLIKKIEKLERK